MNGGAQGKCGHMGEPLRIKITELPHPSNRGLGGAPGEKNFETLVARTYTTFSAFASLAAGACSKKSLSRSSFVTRVWRPV